MKAIRPNPTAVNVKASTSGTRLTLTFSSSSIGLRFNSTEGTSIIEEMMFFLPPAMMTRVVGAINPLARRGTAINSRKGFILKERKRKRRDMTEGLWGEGGGMVPLDI